MYNKPSSINVIENGERLILERRWLNLSAWGVIIFAIVWNGLLILYAQQSFAAEANEEELFLLIPTGIVGLIAIYLAIAAALNHTRFVIDQQSLAVTHAPIPWIGKTVERDAIQQIVVKQHRNSGTVNRRHIKYSVQAQLEDGALKRLIGDLASSAEAFFIKQAIHDYLNLEIPDGEYLA